jgi:hypothetical protein
LYCTIVDNGIGRERSMSMKHFQAKKHKSHGIEITLKRIELFNKEHGKNETVVISDPPGGGTKVCIPIAWEDSF